MTPAAQRWLALPVAAVWAACALATSGVLLRGMGVSPIFIAAAPDGGFPQVSGLRQGPTEGTAGDLRVGDRLRRIDGADLRGVGPVRFFAVFAEHARGGKALEAEYERDAAVRTTAVAPGSMIFFLPLLLASVVFAAVALLLWLRAGSDPAARGFALCFANLAIFLSASFFGSRYATYTAMGLHVVTMTLLGPLSLYALLRFVSQAPLTLRARAWPWLFTVLGPLHTGHFGGPVPPRLGIPAAALVVVTLLAVICAVITRAWRRADAIGRRRIKWLLLGLYGAAMPPIVAGLLTAVNPAFAPAYSFSLTAVACIPLALLIAIARLNLFDVDRLISVAGSYNVLIAVAIAAGLLLVPPAAAAAADWLGIDASLGRIGLSIPLALFVVQAHQRLRPQIDRIFFPERHALDTGIHNLLIELRSTGDVASLVRRMGAELVRLIRPESCIIYVRDGEFFAPVFVESRVTPPALAADGRLVATMLERRHPLELRRAASLDAGISSVERATFETLDAAVVVPIWRGGHLFSLVSLGAKRSGDVYTPTDVRLLAAIAETVSERFDRLDQTEMIRQSRRLQERLRRYVPAPVAEVLDSDGQLEPDEREVSVLFVDLRGYTALCEPLGPQEIFDTTSRYTDAIAEVIRGHGGTIVEFSGDGMMAIFGAPRALPGKEEAAVRAARALVAELRNLGPAAGDRPFSVGVGIATGPALCGNISSADHVVWTALGNIVNLAARLQALTRDLAVLIAIDTPTHAAAAAVAADFCRREKVQIRGRSEPQDVYVLPLAAAVAAA